MPFVIIDAQREPLADLSGKLIVISTEAEAKAWLKPGERVEGYSPERHHDARR